MLKRLLALALAAVAGCAWAQGLRVRLTPAEVYVGDAFLVEASADGADLRELDFAFSGEVRRLGPMRSSFTVNGRTSSTLGWRLLAEREGTLRLERLTATTRDGKRLTFDGHPEIVVRALVADPAVTLEVAAEPADPLPGDAVTVTLTARTPGLAVGGRMVSPFFNVSFFGQPEPRMPNLAFDVTLVILACLLSLVFLSNISGVREGTVTAALIVGPIVHFVSPYYRFLDKWISSPAPKQHADKPAGRHTIITIAREFGSGGHLLGEMLAKELDIRLYDKEFIHLAAQRSNMDEQYIAKNEQSIPSFWLKCILSKNSEQPLESSLSPEDVLFVAESKIIQELAAKGPVSL